MIARAVQPPDSRRAPMPAAPADAARATDAGRPTDTARRIEDLGRIILAYSEITERLQRSHEQLTRTVESLRGELVEKDRLLERRNRLAALGEMAAGLAHEIRNPLGGIQLYASMLARDLADREEAVRVVGKISAGVRRLEALVGQVLRFSREIHVSPQPTDLAAIVAQAVEYASRTMQERGVICMVQGDPLSVTADPLLLGQALLNLLLNAAEAIDGGGSVFVRFGPMDEPGRFQISVADTGPGIPDGVLDRIFNPFFTTKDGGTGLGLAIAHRIVEAHEGTLTAANRPEGGARFEVRI